MRVSCLSADAAERLLLARLKYNAPQRRRADAWLGDSALRMLVALLGTKAGLTACQMDGICRECLTNDALRSMEDANPTDCEAAVGMAVQDGSSDAALLKKLRADVARAAPSVLRAIEQKTAQKP